MHIETVSINLLRSDPENARKHDQRNLAAIANSLNQFGQRKPIVITHNDVVIAGNGTLEAAKRLGWTEIAVARTPKDWDEATIKAYALADNQSGALAEWDNLVLERTLTELMKQDWDVAALGFDDQVLSELMSLVETGADGNLKDEIANPYSTKIDVPQYEIVGDQPEVSELLNDSKTKALQAEIEASDLPSDVKGFLTAAAHRHTVFNYGKIAEFYPHQSGEIQKLMQDSVLVIIDFDDAMKLGYVKLTNKISALLQEDADSE